MLRGRQEVGISGPSWFELGIWLQLSWGASVWLRQHMRKPEGGGEWGWEGALLATSTSSSAEVDM